MKKYFSELKKVTWPKSDEVFSQFWIVLLGIIAFVLFFFLADWLILEIVQKLYT